MDFSSLSFIRLAKDHPLKDFDCGDADLTDFFHNDCKNYLSALLAVTYVIQNEDETIAFFSLLNDKITIKDVDGNSAWNKLRRKLHQRKRFTSYPAMKIGRLGVHNKHKGKQYGTAILDYLKVLFVTNNRTGCKYITVDAYKQSLRFYENNGFEYLTEKDKDSDTRLMYFDLANIYGKVNT
ncbi:MAG: GNAT family N-acetyltransferase [Chitinophagaceae bacterium]